MLKGFLSWAEEPGCTQTAVGASAGTEERHLMITVIVYNRMEVRLAVDWRGGGVIVHVRKSFGHGPSPILNFHFVSVVLLLD